MSRGDGTPRQRWARRRQSDALDAGWESTRRAAIRGAQKANAGNEEEDRAHDALKQLLEAGSDGQSAERLAYTIAFRRAIEEHRSPRSRVDPMAQIPELSDPAEWSAEERVAARSEALDLLRLAGEVLTPKQYEALVVMVRHGGSVTDAARVVAEASGQSVNAVRLQIERARRRMRNVQGEHDE